MGRFRKHGYWSQINCRNRPIAGSGCPSERNVDKGRRWRLPPGRSAVFFAAGLAALAIISGWLQAAYEDNDIHRVISHSFGAALYIFIAALLFKTILTEKNITSDQLFAAIAIYIFIGLTWGNFYALVGTFDPNSILGITVATNGNDGDFIYFSFVTLTTLGYGDMLPVNAVTKALVILEAITGVMFVAILVSTLVGRVNLKR